MSRTQRPYMEQALELAKGVLGTTSPNPAVGCVIVKDGLVVGDEPVRDPHLIQTSGYPSPQSSSAPMEPAAGGASF